MELWISIVYLLIAWISVHFLRFFLKRSPLNPKRLPPGPFPFPIIGNIFKLGSKPHESLADLAKAYGPVFALELGCLTTVVMSSVPMAKEVLQKHDVSFPNRMVIDACTALDHHQTSLLFLPQATKWRNIRRVCNSYVFSNNRLEASRELRKRKVHQLLSHVKHCSKAGTALNIGQAAFDTNLNILSNSFFSMDLTDLRTNSGQGFKETIMGMMVVGGTPNIADFFPVFKLIDPQRIRHRTGIFFRKMITTFDAIIDERLQSRKHTNFVENKDVLDDLLCIVQRNSHEFELSDLPHLLLDLFVAGTDTTSSTVEWAMAELLRNPKKLKKAQVELEEVLGRHNPMEEKDISRLPYLQAVIKETLRLHPPVSFLIPRKVDKDVELCDYIVPKGAQVLVNVWAMGRDPSIWVNANLFEPERFLELDIDFKGNYFQLIPFGAGRRICPGLSLASRILHLILGSLIQSFNWKLDGEVAPNKMDMNEKYGLTVHKAQSLIAIPSHIFE